MTSNTSNPFFGRDRLVGDEKDLIGLYEKLIQDIPICKESRRENQEKRMDTRGDTIPKYLHYEFEIFLILHTPTLPICHLTRKRKELLPLHTKNRNPTKAWGCYGKVHENNILSV